MLETSDSPLLHRGRSGFRIPYAPVLAAFAVTVLYFLFHFHFMQQFLSWDQVWYANNIRNMLEGSLPYFNPHHLHYETGGRLFHEFMIRNFGDAGFTNLMFNNRLRSLVTACIGIFFVILYLKEATGKLIWGIIGGVLAGFCHGFLAYATQGDTPIFPASAFCVILYLIKKTESAERFTFIYAAVTGVMLALSVMLHQFMAFSAIAAVLCLLLPRFFFSDIKIGSPFFFRRKTTVSGENNSGVSLFEGDAFVQYRAAGIAAVAGICLVCGAYFYTGKSVFNLPFDRPDTTAAVGRYSYTSYPRWLFLYQAEGWWATGFVKFDPRRSFRGFTNAVLSPVTRYKYLRYESLAFDYDITHPEKTDKLVHNSTAYFTLIPLLGTLLLFPLLFKRYRRTLVFLLASGGLFTFFISYWEPLYFEFWLVPCIAVIVLAVLFLNFLSEKLKFLLGRFSPYPFYALALVFLLALSSHNVLYYLIPYSRYKHMEDIDLNWRRSYYMDLFSDPVYKYPDDPYKMIYTTKPER